MCHVLESRVDVSILACLWHRLSKKVFATSWCTDPIKILSAKRWTCMVFSRMYRYLRSLLCVYYIREQISIVIKLSVGYKCKLHWIFLEWCQKEHIFQINRANQVPEAIWSVLIKTPPPHRDYDYTLLSPVYDNPFSISLGPCGFFRTHNSELRFLWGLPSLNYWEQHLHP